MPAGTKKKIVRLLGVGFDTEDGHVRITHSEKYDVLMGSDESHEFMSGLIDQIEKELESRGLKLDDLYPDELKKIVQSLK